MQKEFSLYIHIPWCVKKCPYCDFNSHAIKGNLPEQEYINALKTDLDLAILDIDTTTSLLRSIFIGGGTPSLFSDKAIAEILEYIAKKLRLSSNLEITMECNPGTVERKYIEGYATAGVNRISLGIQSFNNQHLKQLGRIHDNQEAINAIEIVAKNFNNFNLDIMYGLPNQSIEQAHHDITQAISFAPTHISAYNLTIEPNTEFAKNIPNNMPNDDICYQIQDDIILLLKNHGYNRYETSAYAKNDCQAWHNKNYWQFGDYLGIGAGAHGKVTLPQNQIKRTTRYKHPTQYIQQSLQQNTIQDTQIISQADIPFEFMLNALRLCDGFDIALFEQQTGLNIATIQNKLDLAQARGFITITSQKIIPTEKGRDFLNDLLIIFLG